MFTRILIAFLFTFVTNYPINIIQTPSSNFNERKDKKSGKIVKPEYIIVHYTTDCFHTKSRFSLSNFFRPVSAHYLIAADGTIYQLVNESKRAWHAGKSSWKNNKQMNSCSIGIEIVNPGFSKHKKNPCTFNKDIWNKDTGTQVQGSSYYWYPFTKQQLDSTTMLCQDLMKRYDIKSEHILGHSDIAPGRKVDPGPLFNWKQLALHNVGVWPNQPTKTKTVCTKEMQQMLKTWGYNISVSGKLDKKTKAAIKAFQIHFRSDNIDGVADDQTVAILQSLLDQYKTV